MSDVLASLRARMDAQKAKAADTGIPFCPHKPTPPQAAFLKLTEFEAFYGGAAGGGKSDCLLMDHLRWFHCPTYSGLILRRTLTDLALPGAIMDRAKSWLIPAGVKWNEASKLAVAPSGARLQFGFCETDNDVFRYQGSEFHRISIDELTQWNEKPYRYLMSRTRRSKRDDIPLAMRGAGNPGGIGHKWVKQRFVTPGDAQRPFVPAKLEDNPHLNREEYAATLANLDEVTRLQLREGKWVDDGTGLVYQFDRARNGAADLPDLTGWHAVLSVDLGSSEIKPTTAFALVMWHESSPVAYVVRSWAEAGMIPSTIADRIRETVAIFPDARIVMDVGALGSGYANEIRQRHMLPVEPAEKAQKLGFRKLLNGALERAEVKVLIEECKMLVDELESLIWAPNGQDNDKTQPNHCTDALLYGWRCAQSWRAAYQKPETHVTEEQGYEVRARERYHARQRAQSGMGGW
jgi:hypothetical protein